MVLSDHGHGDRVSPPAQPALQWDLVILDFRRDICSKCASIYHWEYHFHPPIYLVSGDLPSYDQASGTVHVHRHVPHGTRHNYQYVLSSLCPCVG